MAVMSAESREAQARLHQAARTVAALEHALTSLRQAEAALGELEAPPLAPARELTEAVLAAARHEEQEARQSFREWRRADRA
jgi:hypothetical protein